MTTAAAAAVTTRRALLVAAGGSVGASARWVVGHELGWDAAPTLPWALLVCNTVGTVLLVVAVQASRRRPERASLLVDGVGTGFCGGLTTFSALAVVTAQHLDQGALWWAGASLVTVVGCGLAAATLTRLALERRAAASGQDP